ncbi:TetR/AcrR family transcriptional regulator [Sphingomonas cavernae]|uniref:TetR/AcrR family transcriptional regulator n=1 Tax=Sphingomonas cavernae TaxID=2320861 RepID=A0A418WJP5_9SPHN|nr:TetR/AcrR family transcriptional regulator [Sphingomonas cavernae]RJF90273.1 TetR/AcrR family transcriptional regulator [Sphingomonas cavernae]
MRQKTPGVRQSILEVAAALFAERGYAGTNLRDITNSLGMSRPGLYYHFPSKEKLLEALVEEITFSGQERSETIVHDAGASPRARLHQLVASSLQWMLEHGQLFRALAGSENDLPADLRTKHDDSKRAVLKSYIEVIEEGILTGHFRPVDATVVAFGIIGMCNWTAWWFKADGRRSLDAVKEELAEAAVRTVLRVDAHRTRSESLADAFRILREDISHLERLSSE